MYVYRVMELMFIDLFHFPRFQAKNAQKDAEDSEKVSIAVKEQAEDLAASLDVKIKMPLDDLREEFAQIEQLRLQIQEQLDEVNKNFEVMEKMDLGQSNFFTDL